MPEIFHENAQAGRLHPGKSICNESVEIASPSGIGLVRDERRRGEHETGARQ
jgi:hypothetical protein